MGVMMYNGNMSNIIIKGIEEDLYRRFKALCVMEGKTLREKFTEMIKEEVKEKEGEGKK